MICLNCGSALGQDSYACSTCGSLPRERISEQRIECENHHGIAAIAACLVCGKPVCGDCALSKESKFFCDNPDHIQFHNEWNVICVCDSEFEDDVVIRNLAGASIEAVSFSLYNHISTFWSGKKEHVQVLVRNEQSGTALNLLHSLGLIDNVDEQSLTL